MALSRLSRDSGMNYWPGFVDALSTLILSIIFLLTVFMVAQFFLSQEMSGKDTALARLNAQISRLSELLSLERTGKTNLEDQIAQLRASLTAAQGERDRLRGAVEGAQNAETGKAEVGKLNSQLDLEKEATARAVAQIEILNQQITALRRQIGALEEALNASEKKEGDSQLRIADLGQRLNVALAQRVQELSRYRSDFFGKLREILGNRPDIRIVGDRFVFQSEVFFDTGQAVLRPEGRAELDKLAAALGELEKQIPSDINWVLRVADLGQRLNVALAQRVQELSRYRSDFFGKLRDILGNRPDIRVVGDRFVFQSEVFFDSGQAALRPEGKAELDQLAGALLDLERQIPAEINWVLRVDGHTDTRQLGPTSPFKSNWELSAARAISVVQYLIGKGVPPQRLVAAGFGEFQPIDPATTDEAYSRNRRIELKLTER